MAVLNQIWSEKTSDFTIIQKTVVALILLFIFATALFALGLVYMELSK